MNDLIVRLSSLTLENIKNVKKGTVCVPVKQLLLMHYIFYSKS